MKINFIIDEKLMSIALKTFGLRTKKEVVEEAPKLFVEVNNQTKLKQLRGKLTWVGDLGK